MISLAAGQRRQDRSRLVCVPCQCDQTGQRGRLCQCWLMDDPAVVPFAILVSIRMRQTTWTPVYFIVQLFYFIALVRPAFSELFLEQHVDSGNVTCFRPLRRLRRILHRVGTEATFWLILAPVVSIFDYCNSLLADRLVATSEPLQP